MCVFFFISMRIKFLRGKPFIVENIVFVKQNQSLLVYFATNLIKLDIEKVN